jgi:(p)ppGpp synthase/HD superfamily hydrolase
VCCLVPPAGSHAQQAVAAAILHDVLDDTDCTPAQLQAEFGAEVLALVVSVTRLSQVSSVALVQSQCVQSHCARDWLPITTA